MPETSTAVNLQNEKSASSHEHFPCKVYERRWAILFLFCLYAIISNVQWIQYSIIADKIVHYYGVSYSAADWTSAVFSLVYVVFSFPGSYLLVKLGLRKSVLIGIVGTCIGAWIKVASVAPDRYWVLLLGQTTVGIFQVLIFPLPPVLASVWFAHGEVALACSIGIAGIELGIAIGFVIPPILIGNTEISIEEDLRVLAYGSAVASSIMLILLFIFFKDKPPTPPSPAEIRRTKAPLLEFAGSVKQLVLNLSFMLLLVAYGISTGIFYALSTLLSQLLSKYYKKCVKDAGGIGLIMYFVGIAGSTVCGALLDKYHHYKKMTITVHAFLVLAMLAFTFTLGMGINMVYLTTALLGVFMTAAMAVGLELGAELTYPVSENVTSGILWCVNQLFAVIMTFIYSLMFYRLGDVWANVILSLLLFFSLILVICIRYDLRRHAAQIAKISSHQLELNI